jgi:hypothetical protein
VLGPGPCRGPVPFTTSRPAADADSDHLWPVPGVLPSGRRPSREAGALPGVRRTGGGRRAVCGRRRGSAAPRSRRSRQPPAGPCPLGREGRLICPSTRGPRPPGATPDHGRGARGGSGRRNGGGPGNDLPPGRPPRKSRRTALLVGITALGLIGLLAGAWAWDLFGLRSRWAPPTPPAVLSWHMPDRIDDLAFGGTLPAKEREAGKTLLVVEVQLPRQLLDGRSGWLEWSVAFHGADLSLVTPDGQASPPLLVTAIDPVGGPPVPSWPPGFGNQDRWIPGSGSARVRGQRPAPERFKVKAAFVVLQSSVRAGGLPRPIQGRPVRAVPAKRCTV